MPTAPPLALLLLIGALCAPVGAFAAECAGVALEDVVELEGTPLRLNGAGQRSVSILFVELDLYVAALYLERPARRVGEVIDALPPSRLLLHFQRDTPRARLTEGFAEAIDRAAPEDASLRARVEQLNGWMIDMRAGSELVFAYLPGIGIRVEVSGQPRGVIPGADFARALLGNWLGPHAVDPRLEAGLLGAACG